LNLLFYVPQMAAYGGMERHVCTLAAAAARRGHTVTVLTTSNSLGDNLRDELIHPRITLRELPLARREAGRWRKLRWLLRETTRARRQHWDLIYTNGQSALAAVAWQASARARIVHHHHTAADAEEQARWSPGFRQVLRSARELVGCSRQTCAALNTATARGDARYLPYLTRPVVPAAAVRERAPGRTLHFGFLGRLIPEKGIDAILRLSTDPTLAHIHWHLHGAGPAYPPETFSGLPNLTYHGTYADAATHARALLALDAVVLFSTHNEGLPLSLIEAMGAGLPWIATDRGGTRELAVSPADALLVAHPASDRQLGEAVHELSRRIRAAATSRRHQRRASDARFSPEVVAAQWLHYLENTARSTIL
jgi:glycosyltransferase involved in cell wall biosynthesis